MYQALLDLHNIGRWVVLILLLVAIVQSAKGMRPNSVFSNGDKKLGFFLMISAHIMLLIGIYQWFAGAWGWQNISNLGMKTVMKNPLYRFWAVEHITGMLVAIVLITIGRRSVKKSIPDSAKYKQSFWYYLIAFVIIVASVPWPFREVSRPLLP